MAWTFFEHKEKLKTTRFVNINRIRIYTLFVISFGLSFVLVGMRIAMQYAIDFLSLTNKEQNVVLILLQCERVTFSHFQCRFDFLLHFVEWVFDFLFSNQMRKTFHSSKIISVSRAITGKWNTIMIIYCQQK